LRSNGRRMVRNRMEPDGIAIPRPGMTRPFATARPLLHLARALERRVIASRVMALLMGELLRWRPARWILNRARERRAQGTLAKTLYTVLDRAEVRGDFIWECLAGNRKFLLPVSTSLPGSWGTARVWAWNGTAPIRAFYELYRRFRPQGTFLDVGANFGIHSYPFAAWGYRCVAFEPQSVCVEYLRRVSALNRFGDFRIESCAVGEDEVGVQFFASSGTWQSSFDRTHVEPFGLVSAMSVDSVSLDTYCARERIDPTLIKIDVETWEWHVLKGASLLIERLRPDLVIEILLSAVHRPDMWHELTRRGYRAFGVRPRRERSLRPLTTLSEFVGAEEENFVFTVDPDLEEPSVPR
jgi:FkbM family methyltransferase